MGGLHENGTEITDTLKASLAYSWDSHEKRDEQIARKTHTLYVKVDLNTATMKLRSNSPSKRPYSTNDDISISESPKKPRSVKDSRSNVSPDGLIDSSLPNEDTELRRITQIVKQKRKISFSHQSLAKSTIRRIAMAVRSLPIKSYLRKLKMRNCNVNKDLLRTLSKEIGTRKIDRLDLSGNKNLNLRVVEEFREKHETKKLILSDSELDQKEIATLAKMKQIKELRLDYNAFKKGPIASALAKIINNGLEELSLVDSRITGKQLVQIAKRLGTKVSLRVLDLSHVTLTKSGIKAIGKIANSTNGMDRLALAECGITEEFLMDLKDVVKEKILELDFSSNAQLSEANVEIVSVLADKVGSEVIDLSSIPLDGAKIRQLMKIKPKQILKLCLSENLAIDTPAVGELAESWKLTNLDISECRLTPKQILLLAQSIGKHKLSCIDVGDPMATLTSERREALKKLCKKTDKLCPAMLTC